jgi:hypothetical protein
MKIKLISRLCWTCPTCQSRNEHSGKQIRNPEDIDEIKHMLEESGLDSEDVGEFTEYPPQVACHKCESVFETEDPE